jgi:tRNA pseudouridine38-40 synthase
VIARVGPDEHRIKLTLHYDGGGFAGWQNQPGKRTVQGELEAALSRLLAAPASVLGAGRTDSGVHATGQVAGATVPRKWGPAQLQKSLNAVLPPDIWVAEACGAPDTFHARYDAVARGYIYRLGTAPVSRSPFRGRWCWPLEEELPLAVLNAAAAGFVGRHSFKAFAKTGQPQRGEHCSVHAADWREWSAGLQFRVVANRFLHHMVRYMVGTMVDVARGRRTADEIEELLRGATKLRMSRPAPAAGLYLTRVFYEGASGERSAGDAAHTWTGEDAADEILS